MDRSKALVAAALCSATLPALAAEPAADVQAQIEALRAEVAQLRGQQEQNWLDDRRAEEVKSLIREVLADAETRASLLESGLTAGHDGKFFLASGDGTFRLNIGGTLQARYIVNYQDDRDDTVRRGFQIRRTKLGFSGHVGDPRFTYTVVVAADREDADDDLTGGPGNIYLEDIAIGYKFTDNLGVKLGRFKLPFAREELISSTRQLGVDRSSVTEYFTLNRGEQIQLNYTTEPVHLYASFSDGANSEAGDWNATGVEYALTGRADVKLAGDWKQARDLVAWEAPFAAFVGGAFHWEEADEEVAGTDGAYWVATADALVKSGPIAANAAVFYAEADDELGGPEDAMGASVQAGYNVTEKFQPFARWEYLDVDGLDDELQLATVGVNYYLRGHNAKFTTDLVWKYAGGNPSTLGTLNGGEFSSGLGLSGGDATDDEDQFALRMQFQLLF